ncbi:NADH-ubiquinone oxidoreductase 20.9 kDa subunit [Apiospora kogelbergensis]|uniref:NADH-ubiquinone oxidoreductase 20.9 kDa subunit n=1 Tax=Apiospora kogelbergensis TaxID=1337665 RepID=A0AAW0QU89_9PEZI
MSTPQQQTYVPSKVLKTDYPLIDNDPHFKRVVGYARPSDYVHGLTAAAAGPGMLYYMEKFSPSQVGRGGFAQAMRLTGVIGAIGGFLYYYQRSTMRFYGMSENAREVDMDMREMVDKVKKGETLYGESRLTPHMQGVAARQSRYSALFMYGIPWFNFVNHSQHGVDTAKYYRQAERELEGERTGKAQGEVATLA